MPAIEKDTIECHIFVANNPKKHLPYMVEFAFSITIRVENSIVHDPIMPVIRINIQAINYCNTSD